MQDISVIIPTKDRPRLLIRAVQSALSACESIDTVIVIDDHSASPAAKALGHIQDPRLRVIAQQDGKKGVSAARNSGIAATQSDIVAFLDDDDELCGHYLSYIRETASSQADFGFSAYMISDDDHTEARPIMKARLPDGPIKPSTPIRKRAFGFGMGFWMRRATFDTVGLLDTSLTINEDTEYACRLARAGLRGWYASQPGVVVHQHRGQSDGQKTNMTSQTDATERARCMKELCDRYPEFIEHLGKGYLRHCLKTGEVQAARNFVGTLPTFLTRTKLRIYLRAKSLGYGLRGGISKGRPAR